MSSHDHHNQPSECVHDVRFCKACDKAYCAHCSREWGDPVCRLTHYYGYQPVYPATPWIWPTWTTSGASATLAVSNPPPPDSGAYLPRY